MKRKTNNHKLKASQESKKTNWTEIIDTRTLQMAPSNDQHKLRIFLGVVEYVTLNEKCYDIEEYLDLQGIVPQTYYDWRKLDPMYQALHDKAKRIIGRRLERIGIEKNLSMGNTSQFILPHYLKRYEEAIEWRNKLKSDVKENDVAKTVIDYMLAGKKD